MPWYKGNTLIQTLNNLMPQVRNRDKPLRLPIYDVFKVGGVGAVLAGRVETGILKKGMEFKFAPENYYNNRQNTIVKSI